MTDSPRRSRAISRVSRWQGLWLPFGVLTFFLNFIPNVGGLGAVLLPMPLIALDPQFSSAETAVSFLVPFGVNIFAKDVLEPKVLGHATDLNPVTILLAILIYGSVWGVTGMVGRWPPRSALAGHGARNGARNLSVALWFA